MNEITIDADEIARVSGQLKEIMSAISESSIAEFDAIKNHPFYEEGKAKEAIDRIFLSEVRKEYGDYELTAASPDLLGKIQMLVVYYNLINEYCIDAILKFKDLDEGIAKLYTNMIEEYIENE